MSDALQEAPTPLQPAFPGESSDDAEIQRFIGPAKAGAIIRLKRLNPNVTHQEIADAVGVHRVTVTKWLSLLETDTVKEARQLSKSQSLRATMKLVQQIEHDDARVSQGAAKAVVALAGVAETGPAIQVGVQVIVGNSAAPAGPDPFEITVNHTPPEVP